MIVSRFVEVAVNGSVRFPTNPSTILASNGSTTKKKEYKNRSERELVTFHLSEFLFSIFSYIFYLEKSVLFQNNPLPISSLTLIFTITKSMDFKKKE